MNALKQSDGVVQQAEGIDVKWGKAKAENQSCKKLGQQFSSQHDKIRRTEESRDLAAQQKLP